MDVLHRRRPGRDVDGPAPADRGLRKAAAADEQPPDDGLRLARRTVEALLGDSLPATWSDTTATLVGTGRINVPDEAAHLAGLLPVL